MSIVFTKENTLVSVRELALHAVGHWFKTPTGGFCKKSQGPWTHACSHELRPKDIIRALGTLGALCTWH